MYIKSVLGCGFVISVAIGVFGQRPPGQPPGGPPPGDPRGRMDRMERPGVEPGGWIRGLDSNRNGKLEVEELRSAVERTFADLDRNANGTIDKGEAEFFPQAGRPPAGPPQGRPLGPDGPRPEGKRLLPPFLIQPILERGQTVSREQFEKAINERIAEMDRNRDGVLDNIEVRPPEGPGRGAAGPPPPNAQFVAAELRFGDRLVTGQPFSAETVIEDTRRLYDGNTVTKTRRGGIYRDGEGRTRREQPLDLLGADGEKPVMLVFVNDFPGRSQFSLDLNAKVARKSPIGDNRMPFPDGDGPRDAKTESLGTRTIEGVRVEGKRITSLIPAGRLGNDKPIEVLSETWFSPELQIVVMSRHLDPVAGEHVFKLVNIRRAEPAADLFAIPAGYKVENVPGRRDE